jgi:uncharacterized protein (DUF1697 family)
MTAYVALLRAVNVGGTGKLPMSDLRTICEDVGLRRVRTYIASGNAVFESDLGEAEVRAALETRLQAYAGKSIGVMVRTAEAMAGVRDANPFKDEPPNRTVALFLNAPPPCDALDSVRNRTTEKLALGVREIYVAYGEGMGQSKLIIPAAGEGTARNINTVTKLAAMAAELV